ncbi:MAG: hypothetical protein ACT6QS_07720 [Flavobacteriales bacterium]
MHSRRTLQKIRESRITRGISVLLISEIIFQAAAPVLGHALTSGPTQPEVEGFQPVGLTEMVDPFTGDFSYSIPLMEIGGYPLNLSYQSGVSMDQEASWAGLGWNLHTGAITRQMRGLPDDFWNDEVVDRANMKPNKTISVNATFDTELFGFEAKPPSGSDKQMPGGKVGLSAGLGLTYNNYTGIDLSLNAGFGLKGNEKLPMNASLNMTSGKDGLTISPNVSYKSGFESRKSAVSGSSTIGIGASINSRRGMTSLGLNGGFTVQKTSEKFSGKDMTRSISGEFGMNNSSSINMGAYTFTPSVERAMETFSFSGRFKINGAFMNQDFGVAVSAYGTVQKLLEQETKVPACGYMYAEKANNNDDVLLDFNREKDNNFSKHHKHLPLTAYTYDIFSIAAQGLTGSFRPHRNEIGYVYNNRKVSPSNSGSLGVELAGGNVIDLGTDFSFNSVTSSSGAWRQENEAISSLPAREQVKNKINEACYFRMMGEKIPEADPAYLNTQIKGNSAIRYNFDHKPAVPKLKVANSFTNSNGGNLSGITNNKRQDGVRVPRNTAVYVLTVAEILSAYPHKRKNISPYAKAHHIAEIIVVTPEGMRYVFGLAAYNTKQVERSFAVGDTRSSSGLATGSEDNKRGKINYNSDACSLDNPYGIDNYYQETETPAYAHTWMLTEILTADYSDLTGNGPSQDDLGAYVSFNYGSIVNGVRVPDVSGYGWRTPSNGVNSATYMQGLRTNKTDDKASVVFGSKDIWYCHSIESKTHKVSFDLADRDDALGVDEHGNLQTTKKLKRINSITYQSVEPGADPIKTVYFDYSYRLCPQTPNSNASGNKGKLTLERVYFTYENSKAGRYNPYEFTYVTTDSQGNAFQYDFNETDRWGAVKPHSKNPNGLYNADYPYAIQDAAYQRDAAAAWSMSSVKLPTGGKIDITYESDDYAWVQDRQTCNMYMIKGFARANTNGTIDASSQDTRVFNPDQSTNDFLLITIPDNAGGSTLSPLEFRTRYLQERNGKIDYGPLKYLYFRFLMNVDKGNQESENEYVSGYAEIDYSDPNKNYGMLDATTAYVKIKRITPTNDQLFRVSPFAYSAWSFSRLYTPEKAYNQPQLDDNDTEKIIKTLASADFTSGLFEMLIGVNKRMGLQGFGSRVDIGSSGSATGSWVRLLDPDGIKYGGGHRVKKIEISDNWQDMAPAEASRKYGQEFSYRSEDGTSSGVAAWEPAMGADENPFKQPVYNDDPALKLVMEERYYVEEPFGESFLPSPGVGYARVEVKDIVYYAGVTSKSTGKTIQEFYTARDFPAIIQYTKIEAVPKRSNPIVSLLSFNSWNYMNASQGYTIEINDMHGKQKRTSMYAEGATEPFAYTHHYYKTYNNGRLNNMFSVLDAQGKETITETGTEYDMVVDFREQETMSYMGSLASNFNYALTTTVPPAPVISISFFPSFKRDHTRFRSVVVTKVIQRYGLLEKTLSFDKGALLETRTVSLDQKTGNTVVQELSNEYKDKYYKTDLPAHWAYTGMAQASDNIMFTFGTSGYNDASNFNRYTGEITSSYLKQYLHPGDEVIRVNPRSGNIDPNSNTNAWHYWVSKHTDGKYYLINYAGAKAIFPNGYPASLEFKVIRSGHRNQQQTPLSSVTSMQSPIRNVSGTKRLVFDQNLNVLATNASQFREQWHTDFLVPQVQTDTTRYNTATINADSLVYILNKALQNGVTLEQGPQQLSTAIMPEFEALFPQCPSLASTFDASALPPYTVSSGVTAPWYIPSGAATGQIFESIGIYLSNETTLGAGMPCTCNDIQLYSLQDNTVFSNSMWNTITSFSIYMGAPMLNTNVPHMILIANTSSGVRFFALRTSCWLMDAFMDYGYTTTYSCLGSGQTVNPYIVGILGNWRAYKNWVFMGDRNNTLTSSDDVLRTDGYLPNYKPFWTFISNKLDTANSGQVYESWTNSNTMTIYSPYGFDLENRNPLNIFSAAVYGFKNMLSVAVASNSMNKETGYDGFEDYYASAFNNACKKPHFWVADNLNRITSAAAHTGLYSLSLTQWYTRSFPLSGLYGNQQTPTVPYVLNQDDLLRGFSLNSGQAAAKTFVLSFWARRSNYNGSADLDITDVGADVKIGSTSLLLSSTPRKTNLVEGWQKFEYLFSVPAGASGNLDLILKPVASQGGTAPNAVYFDDIRIHPNDAHMKSYVYNRLNFRYMAELDENNFATFYEYDREGKLVRVKKETERGVMTIQENRNHASKRQNLPLAPIGGGGQ